MVRIYRVAEEFEWDGENSGKLGKHKVSSEEAEEAFFDIRRKIYKDIVHSHNEARYLLIGKTQNKKLLFIVFTQRNKKIRIISARKINTKEEYLYEKKT